MIPATSDRVHTIVFWSKNFGPFIEGGYGKRLLDQGHNLYFNFTINSDNEKLEPGVPPLTERVTQMERLADLFGPKTIQWRFDPICYYKDTDRERDNLNQFKEIAHRASATGIDTCITSFVDLYRKVMRRLSTSGLELYEPPMERKIEKIAAMARFLEPLDIRLMLCCEKEVLEALPTGVNVCAAACIPNHRLAELYGPDVTLRKDSGQRVASGCGCRHSRDIGSYRLHPCYHNCLFCYANPASDRGNGSSAPASATDKRTVHQLPNSGPKYAK